MKRLVKYLLYSKNVPILGFAIVVVFLIALYVVYLPLMSGYWQRNIVLLVFTVSSICFFTIIVPLYCLVISIIFEFTLKSRIS